MSNKNNNLVEELFQAGAHIGHKTNRVHPKAKKYIYTIQNGVSIIDLVKTAELLEKAKQFAKDLGQEKKKLLVVVTKRLNSVYTQELCQKYGIPHITMKWPAGLLTNFEMISKNVKKLKQMREDKDKGEWNKFVKHEQTNLNKLLVRLNKFYGGLENLEKLPDALFVIDIRKEKNAVEESREFNIPVIAVVDTNVNPDIIQYPIPANDDSITSIQFFMNQIIETYATALK
ncbi:MAG: 30S ribosomal protein S2 [Candidatus Roizmanbacteria bacterium GW2011_GWA2_36_23]|uniref:Small ribosomal subunit protein uS2 n=1 Tax=Candidatus Roizmanbacteria bacterium GW2011_GWA2_36_23 TaxID=1618480 RepID=A0A0G0GPS3_9BACT|nr:MAG: 30S ribosomal protein S2 [Candidatus Roizmanbacteria bacterium GW2011_GWA2_36_23]